MKKILMIIGVVCYSAAANAAGCPAGFEEIPLENIVVTTDDNATCSTVSSRYTKYYDIPQQCTAHILK